MSGWLEEEERKQSQSDRKQAQIDETLEAAHRVLKPFYDLCSRVSRVRKGYVTFDRLVASGRQFVIESVTEDRDGWRSGTYGRHAIAIRSTLPKQILVEAIVQERVYSIDPELGDISFDRERLVVRAETNLDTLAAWPQEQILRSLQWLILEGDAIDSVLPGKVVAATMSESRQRYHAFPRRHTGLDILRDSQVPMLARESV